MRHSLIRRFPKSWRVPFVILRSAGGRDKWGNALPDTELPYPDALIAPRVSSEPNQFSDLADATAVLYADPQSGLTFASTDRIRIPDGYFMAGTWSVAGRPGQWPFGWEVGLK